MHTAIVASFYESSSGAARLNSDKMKLKILYYDYITYEYYYIKIMIILHMLEIWDDLFICWQIIFSVYAYVYIWLCDITCWCIWYIFF